MRVEVVLLQPQHIQGAVELQALAFPPPFDAGLLWQAEHLQHHVDIFPAGQWVGLYGGKVVATSSNTLMSSQLFLSGKDWDSKVGGYFLDTFDPVGDTLYGLDISVHPDYRGQGIGRELYQKRFEYARQNALSRYGTSCRIPDFASSGVADPDAYVNDVVTKKRSDRTLTPLLKYGMNIVKILPNHMDDEESRNTAILLEWKP